MKTFLDGSSANKVIKSGAGTMAVSNVSWGGKLQIEGGKVAFDGFASSPLSDEANAIVIRNGALDAGGAPVTIQQDVQAGATPVLQDGATLLNGDYTLTGPTGYLTAWPPSTVTVGEGATLNTSCQLFDNPATAGRRVLRVVDGGVFRSSTEAERHLASGNTADTAFVLDVDGGKALFQSWGYIYFGSRQGGRRYTEVHLSNGAAPSRLRPAALWPFPRTKATPWICSPFRARSRLNTTCTTTAAVFSSKTRRTERASSGTAGTPAS